MKNLIIALLAIFFVSSIQGQSLPKDVEQVYNAAEKEKGKKNYNKAVELHKNVLRSVNYIPSLVSIGDIEMILKPKPNYREAAEYYSKAVEEIANQINLASKKGHIKKLTQLRDEVTPKRNKAQSYVDDFDKAIDKRSGGSRLMDDDE